MGANASCPRHRAALGCGRRVCLGLRQGWHGVRVGLYSERDPGQLRPRRLPAFLSLTSQSQLPFLPHVASSFLSFLLFSFHSFFTPVPLRISFNFFLSVSLLSTQFLATLSFLAVSFTSLLFSGDFVPPLPVVIAPFSIYSRSRCHLFPRSVHSVSMLSSPVPAISCQIPSAQPGLAPPGAEPWRLGLLATMSLRASPWPAAPRAGRGQDPQCLPGAVGVASEKG